MNCPYCGKSIDISDVRQHPERYYLYANMCGIVWHVVCLNRVLAGWVDGMRYLKMARKKVV
jgi:hypothetical protein